MKNLKWFIPILSISACNNQAEQNIENLSDITYNYQPNILWISVEDIGCKLASYGDSTANTPTINRLANEGIVFDNAFTVAGVCAPSRSSIISGMYPTGMATHNMRTRGIQPPSAMKEFPVYLREAGYYCTNNWKEDYNFTPSDSVWDESGINAHYKNRQPGQPFFAVFNLAVTHESMTWGLYYDLSLVSTDSVKVPQYLPQDNFIVKRDLAKQYSNIMLMDHMAELHLKELESRGLLDSTIVVFWSDHGGPMPREKREVYMSGIKVPMIIRFPDGLLEGTRSDDLISLMDLAPTTLALAGIEKPEHMDGKIFIGPDQQKRDYIFAARNRMDGQVDMVRSFFDGKFQYIRNYYPEKSNIQMIDYRFTMRTMREIWRMYEENELEGPITTWFNRTKHVEELYDVENDPFQLNNLAEDDHFKEALGKMRDAFLNFQDSLPDMGLIPEAELYVLQEQYGMPVADFIKENPLYYERIYNIANKSLFPDKNLSILIEATKDTIPTVRFWAIKGLGNSSIDHQKTISILRGHQNDPSAVVRAMVARSLIHKGLNREGNELFKKLFKDESISSHAKGLAVNMAGDLYEKAKPFEKHFTYIKENARYPADRAARGALRKIGSK